MGSRGLGRLRSRGSSPVPPSAPSCRGTQLRWCRREHRWQPRTPPAWTPSFCVEMHVKNLSSPSLMLEFIAKETIPLF